MGLAGEIASTLGALETGLLSQIQNGAQGAVGLDEILYGLSEIVRALRGQYLRLQEILERRLRDAVHRQIIETYQEMSELEEAERELRARPDEALAAALLEEPGLEPPITGQG